MTGYIDIAKINQRKSELQAELVKLESLMELIENFARPAEPPQAVTPTPPTQLSMPMAAYNVQEPKRGFTAGLRRAVILSLHTGPTTEPDLARALAWPVQRTRTVLMTMLKFKICYLSEHGKMTLSEEGRTQAAWYIANPAMLTYRPNGKRGVVV